MRIISIDRSFSHSHLKFSQVNQKVVLKDRLKKMKIVPHLT